jgi:N6-adenosine-specific RNA methylase IME4
MNEQKITEVPISDIKIVDRKRKRIANIEELSDSIQRLGLLTPIVLREDMTLIAGERRIKAFESLGRITIPARFVSLDDILSAEIDENNQREGFCVSEKVAIADALKERLGERRGKQSSKNQELENADECPLNGEKTRDYISKRAGLGSSRVYRQAKAVLENAIPEVVEAMDSNVISVNCAHRISQIKQTKQLTALNESKEDPGTDGGALDELNTDRRKAKRAKKLHLPESPEADPIYNIIKVAPNWFTELESDIAALPVSDYAINTGMVAVLCPNEFIGAALRCISEWGFYYAATITAYNMKLPDDAGHLEFINQRSWHIVLGRINPDIYGASTAQVPPVYNKQNPQQALDDILAELFPDKKDTRLDMSSTEARPGWKVWKLDYAAKE